MEIKKFEDFQLNEGVNHFIIHILLSMGIINGVDAQNITNADIENIVESDPHLINISKNSKVALDSISDIDCIIREINDAKIVYKFLMDNVDKLDTIEFKNRFDKFINETQISEGFINKFLLKGEVTHIRSFGNVYNIDINTHFGKIFLKKDPINAHIGLGFKL